MNKDTLRKSILRQSREMNPDTRQMNSQKIWDNLYLREYLDRATTILFYWSLPDEVVTHQQVTKMAAQKHILLPTIVDNNLVLKSFTGVESLLPDSRYGILEPIGKEFNQFEAIDIVIVPGVAFDSQCHRLGRGKGFYDRLLPQIPHAVKIGVCFDHQIVEELPSEPHDVLMDLVISPSLIINRHI